MKYFGAFLLLIMISFSCNDDDTYYDGGSFFTSEYGTGDDNAHIESITQAFSVEAGGEEVCFTSLNGVEVCLNTTCLTDNGQPLGFGFVDVKYVEIFDRGDMLLGNKPAVGLVDGEQVILDSGGEFRVELFYQGEKLELDWYSPICDIKMTIPCQLTGDCNEEMSGWSGSVDQAGNFNWNLSDIVIQSPTIGLVAGVNGLTGNAVTVVDDNYEMIVQDLGWRNCDVLAQFDGPNIPITIECNAFVVDENIIDNWPEVDWEGLGSTFSFDNLNSRIGVAFPTVNTLMNMTGGENSIFTQSLPSNEECDFILMAPLDEDGEVFLYAVKNTIIGDDPNITISSNEILIGNKSELLQVVNSL